MEKKIASNLMPREMFLGNKCWVEARQMIRKASPTSDGGYILSGYSYSNDGDLSRNQGSSFWVVKLEEVSTAGSVYFDQIKIASETQMRMELKASTCSSIPDPSL